MEIAVWSFFTILIGQAACFPGFEFGSLAQSGVSDDFMEDLKKLMSDEGLTKDNEDVQHLLNGLMKEDFNQEPDNHPFKLGGRLSSFSNQAQQPSSTNSDLPNTDQSLSESNQSESPPSEVKSLSEWIRIDRLGAGGASEKIVSLEAAVQEAPANSANPTNNTKKLRPLNLRPMESTAQGSADFIAEVSQPIENASLETDHSLDNVKTDQTETAPPTVVENHPTQSDPFRGMFRFKIPSSMEESSKQQGGSLNAEDHASSDVRRYESVDWMRPSTTDSNVPPPVQDDDDDDDDDDDTSIANKVLNQISSWGQYLFGSS